jgi:hypothetical protein
MSAAVDHAMPESTTVHDLIPARQPGIAERAASQVNHDPEPLHLLVEALVVG